MKQTGFHEAHLALSAKMVEFAGYAMPIQYPEGIIAEHKAVRENVGVFDVSHMGEVEVHGAQALEFIQHLAVNDASKLEYGKAQYSAMCYEDGGIVDDLLVYKLKDHYMLVINASNIDKDLAWMTEQAASFPDVTLRNVSDEIHLLAVQGPKSIQCLQPLTETNLEDIAFYTFVEGTLAGKEMIISRTGYTGELGFELYFRGSSSDAMEVWNAVMESGESFGIQACGLGSRDTLRLEKGYCLYGNDITHETHPIEAGLGWITKLTKESFVGKDVCAKAKEHGVVRRLVGFVVEDDKFIPRAGYPIHVDERQVGYVTSGNISPILGKGIGLGYVEKEFSKAESEINIFARKKNFKATVTKPPFV